MGVNQSKGSVDITSTPNKGKVAEDIVKPEINGKSDEKIIDEKTTVRNCFEKCSMNLRRIYDFTHAIKSIFLLWCNTAFELIFNWRSNFKCQILLNCIQWTWWSKETQACAAVTIPTWFTCSRLFLRNFLPMIRCGGTLKPVFISLRMNANYREMINVFVGNFFWNGSFSTIFWGIFNLHPEE